VRLGCGVLGAIFATVGVAGALALGWWDGRHEGRSQHNAISSRSCDSGVEHPEKSRMTRIYAKWDEMRDDTISVFSIAWFGQAFDNVFGRNIVILYAEVLYGD